MDSLYSRRHVIKAGLGSLASASALGLVACDSQTSNVPAPGSGSTALNMIFWGTAARNKLTQKAINLFHNRNSGITITSEYAAFIGIWKILDTRVQEGKTPDLIQMDMRYLAKYVKSGLMLDLTQLIYNQAIDLSDFDPLMLAGSKANNALYGIPLGGNYQCLLYDTTVLEKLDVGAVPKEMNWNTFATYMNNIAQASGKSVYGTGDASGDFSSYEIWVRQRGKELYTVDGRLAFTVQDVADWFDYWNQMRIKGGCVPSSVQATTTSVAGAPGSSLIHGKSVFVLPHSNEFEVYQALTKHDLALHAMPTGDKAGLYFKPSQLLAISAQTPYATQAARFIDFLINDPNGIKAIGIERGLPGTVKAQILLRPSFTSAQKEEVAFTNSLSGSDMVRLKEVLDPPLANQAATIFTNVATDIGFKRLSVSAGAQAFYTATQKVLAAKG